MLKYIRDEDNPMKINPIIHNSTRLGNSKSAQNGAKFLGVAPTVGEKSVVLKVSETAASYLTCLTSLHAPANLS